MAELLASEQDRRHAFASCDPVADVACVEPFVRAFGRRVFRRALDEQELATFLALYASTASASPRDGVTAVVSALLQAPQFLYRAEPSTAAEFGPALASRLSYLVTASAPDEELLLAAENGELSDDSALLTQAERLLAMPRAGEAFGHFMTEWWNLDQLLPHPIHEPHAAPFRPRRPRRRDQRALLGPVQLRSRRGLRLLGRRRRLLLRGRRARLRSKRKTPARNDQQFHPESKNRATPGQWKR